MPDLDIGGFILFMVALLFSLSVHETGHALVSYWFGDDLAKSQGRISLNPIVHIDPLGTLLFPAIGFFGGVGFGWAKPVPVNPFAWRDKRIANFWVSIAGIIGNLLIALCAGIIIRVLMTAGVITNNANGTTEALTKFLFILFTLNVSLAIFNFLPIPPLDGSKILQSILPDSMAESLEQLDRFGFLFLFLLIPTPLFGMIHGAIMPLFIKLLFIGA